MKTERNGKLINAIQDICENSFVVKKIVMDGKTIFEDDPDE